MKRKIIWILVLAFDILGVIAYVSYTHANAAPIQQTVCPPGQYAIDIDVCRNEPTGCPYGDSVPLDSPKCAPPTSDSNAQVLYNAIEPVDDSTPLGK